MGVRLGYKVTPGFLDILEGVVRPDVPGALELGFYTEATRKSCGFLTLWWTMRNPHFCRLTVFIQRKKAVF